MSAGPLHHHSPTEGGPLARLGRGSAARLHTAREGSRFARWLPAPLRRAAGKVVSPS